MAGAAREATADAREAEVWVLHIVGCGCGSGEFRERPCVHVCVALRFRQCCGLNCLLGVKFMHFGWMTIQQCKQCTYIHMCGLWIGADTMGRTWIAFLFRGNWHCHLKHLINCRYRWRGVQASDPGTCAFNHQRDKKQKTPASAKLQINCRNWIKYACNCKQMGAAGKPTARTRLGGRASRMLDKHAETLGRPASACQDICCKKAILCLQRHEKPLFVSISR